MPDRPTAVTTLGTAMTAAGVPDRARELAAELAKLGYSLVPLDQIENNRQTLIAQLGGQQALDRLAAMLDAHAAVDGGPPLGCAAHDEGEYCCIDALTDDGAWLEVWGADPYGTVVVA